MTKSQVPSNLRKSMNDTPEKPKVVILLNKDTFKFKTNIKGLEVSILFEEPKFLEYSQGLQFTNQKSN